jgi:hypothetical protein
VKPFTGCLEFSQARRLFGPIERAIRVEFQDFRWGSDNYKTYGEMMPERGVNNSVILTPSFSA